MSAGAEAVEGCRRPGWLLGMRGIFRLTWGGLLAWRRVPGLIALILLNPLLATLALSAAPEEHLSGGFEMWVLRLYVSFMVPIACLISGGAMIRDELQAGTLGFLITRPLSRARLLLLKYLCHGLWLEVALGLNVVLLAAGSLYLGVENGLETCGWLLGIQLVMIPAYMAISVVLGLVSKRYVMLGVLYGFIVEMGIGQIPSNINTISVSRHFQSLLGYFSDLETGLDLPGWGVPGAVLAVVTINLLALGVGMLLFSLKEFQEDEAPK